MAGGGWAAFGPIWCPPSVLQPARRHSDYPRPTCDPFGARGHPRGAHTSPVAPGRRSAPAAGWRHLSAPTPALSLHRPHHSAVSIPAAHTDQRRPLAGGTPAAASEVRGGTVDCHPPPTEAVTQPRGPDLLRPIGLPRSRAIT